MSESLNLKLEALLMKFGLRMFTFWNKNTFLQAPVVVSDLEYVILSYCL